MTNEINWDNQLESYYDKEVEYEDETNLELKLKYESYE